MALLMGNEYNLNRFPRRAAEFAELHAFSKTLLPADAPELLRQYMALTMSAQDAGRFSEAEAMVKEAVRIAAQGGAERAAMLTYLQGIQGRTQMTLGHYPQAIASLRAALDATQRQVGAADRPETVLAQIALAVALIRHSETQQAEALLAAALPIANRLEPVAGELTISVLEVGAEAALQRGDLAEAKTRLSAIEKVRATAPKISDYEGSILRARLALAEHQPQLALTTIERLRSEMLASSGTASNGLNDIVLAQMQIQALIDLKRPEEAWPAWQAIQSGDLSSLPAAHELHAEQLALEAQLLRTTKPEEAKRQQQAALKRCASALSPQHSRCRVMQQRFTAVVPTTPKE